MAATALIMNAKLAARFLPARRPDSKKGDNGTVLVAGGSRFYHGAPVLASMAALRSGADLVYTAVPRSIITPIRAFSPAIIALPLPDDKLTVGSANRLVAMTPKHADSAAIGMGMTIAGSEPIIALVRKLRQAGTRLLLDASALIPEILPEISGSGAIVTPHAGEYARLFQGDPGKTEKERIASVTSAAKKHEITVLLKGPSDVVSDGTRTGINRTHNCAMTVGGTGDALSGLTAGLMTRAPPFEAAMLGVYFNGVAGNLAYKKSGLHLIATDIVDNMAAAIKPYDRIS
ncbi:MAG TPA: NAD(P)H-hydrate dehydratase [Nitrososphaera sp.]|nr:NAD(P)H-hydrate dehydratase [Nitrososphaera sp.]